jgi:hypothetical protein
MKMTIISDKGTPMMVIQKITRKNDTLEITGQLMGAWPAKMYITCDQFGSFLRSVFSPSVLMYVLLYPYFLISNKLRRKPQPDVQ